MNSLRSGAGGGRFLGPRGFSGGTGKPRNSRPLRNRDFKSLDTYLDQEWRGRNPDLRNQKNNGVE